MPHEGVIVVPDWIWFSFIFAFGCCIGSFLNVVIYRLPQDKSLIKPPSACPACGKHIRFYDNIPLVSWILLRAKCRYCKAPISLRYFIIELLTGIVFVGLFFLYFRAGLRSGIGTFSAGGWFVYLLHIIMLAALIAASAIDLKLWVIPLCICWFITAAGFIASAAGVFVIAPEIIWTYDLLPSASVTTGSLAAGAAVGLVVSLVCVAAGLIKRSYGDGDLDVAAQTCGEQGGEAPCQGQWKHRLEVCRELVFLAPIAAFSLGAFFLVRSNPVIGQWWLDFSQKPAIAGFLGSLWGYFIGAGVVWITRIAGTLAFGKEAMGLGDVHLMGAAGAVIGPVLVVVAFFIAPFFGLAWAGVQMFFKKTRQIPYGPFLSLGILAAMILHDRILDRLGLIFVG